LHFWLTAVCVVFAPSKLRLVAGQDFDADNLMEWHKASDDRALCNDYSRAGFFLRRNSSSDRWIIFLESGSLCFSNSTCNRRFFRDSVSQVDTDPASALSYACTQCVLVVDWAERKTTISLT